MASSSNPAFANPAFQEQRPGLTPPAAQTQFSTASAQAADAAVNAQLEGAFAAPSAGAVDTATVHLAADAADPRPRDLARIDDRRGRFTVPPRTALVFVVPERAAGTR